MKCYKAELDLNDKQITACMNHAGAARFAYNWGLKRKNENYAAGLESPRAMGLSKEITQLKKTEFPWMKEVSAHVFQVALQNLDAGMLAFFKRCKNPAIKKKGFPKFKSRKDGIGSFSLYGNIVIDENQIRLPRLGWLRLKEHGYFPANTLTLRIKSATVSERAGHWFVSILTDETPKRALGTEVLGVDVGIKSLAVLSDGTIFENPRALKKSQEKLRRLQKSVSRKVKGSANRKKAVALLARQHYRVSCIRKDALHKASDAIAKRSKIVVLESLNIQGMMQNHCLAGAIGDASFGELLRQIEYKMKWAGGLVIKADRWYASSKTCSACGEKKEKLGLGERTFVCEVCGFEADRDHNAAINLARLAVSSTVTACGEESSGRVAPKRGSRAKLASVKQEPNIDEAQLELVE